MSWYCIVLRRLTGRLAQLVERFVYTEEVSQVRALYRPPFYLESEREIVGLETSERRLTGGKVANPATKANKVSLRSPSNQ